MTPVECMEILELPASASPDEVKHAYRRLAHQYHPDKHPSDAAARERFLRISEAYRVLNRVSRVIRTGRQVGSCSKCRVFGELVRNMEGSMVCPRCALGNRQRYLPLPILTIARCTIPLLLLGCAVVMLCYDGPAAAGLAFILSLAGLGTLALTCFLIRDCMPVPRNHRRRRPYRRW